MPVRFSLIILSLISPIMGLIVALRSKKNQIVKFGIILFFIIYGSGAFFNEGVDASRHLKNVENHYIGLGINEWFDELVDIIKLSPDPETNDDPFLHIISYISGIFYYPRLLYIIVSLIYGYVFAIAMLKILKFKSLKKVSFAILFFSLLFILWKNVEGINSIRNHTGAWVLFVGVLGYVQNGKRKNWLPIALAPIIHFQYLLIIIPVIIVLLSGVRPFLYSVLFMMSFFLTVQKNSISSQISNTELGQSKVKAYVKDDEYFIKKNEMLAQKRNWYVNYAATSTYILPISIVILFILTGYYFERMTLPEVKLFSIGLLMIVFANIFKEIPSLSSRVTQNAGLYLLPIFISVFQRQKLFDFKWWTSKAVVFLFMISSLFFGTILVLYKVSLILEYTSVFMLSNPLPVIFDSSNNFSIKEALRFLK